MNVRILFIGDIVGQPGRKIVKRLVPDLKTEKGVDLCVANAENVAGGSGLTPDLAQDLLDSGVDLLTTGDHVWRKREIINALQKGLPILRPENSSAGAPGKVRGGAEVRSPRASRGQRPGPLLGPPQATPQASRARRAPSTAPANRGCGPRCGGLRRLL